MKKRYVIALCTVPVLAVLGLNAPAAWLAPVLRSASDGALDFAYSWGTVWDGSAQLLIRRSSKETLLVPQAFAWRLDTSDVLRDVMQKTARITVQSPALQAPVLVTLQSPTVQLGAGQYSLPADSLNTLGAPFNTLKPSGALTLIWPAFSTPLDTKTPPAVALSLNINDLRSRVTGDVVLGSYTVTATPKGAGLWAVQLQTTSAAGAAAALQLAGTGTVGLNSAPQFELRSQAASGEQASRLQALLNFLGRREGAEHVLRVN